MLLRIFLKQGVSEAFRHHTKIVAPPPENAETPEQHCCCMYYIGVISLNLFVRRCCLPRFVRVPRSPPSGFRSALHPENPTATFSRPPCLPVAVHIAGKRRHSRRPTALRQAPAAVDALCWLRRSGSGRTCRPYSPLTSSQTEPARAPAYKPPTLEPVR